MAVTPNDVADALGRPRPDSSSPTFLQWSLWIDDVRRLISNRLGDLDALDQENLDFAVREVVAERARYWTPGGTSSETVTVDDGTVTKRWEDGRVSRSFYEILEDWWDLLNPTVQSDAWTIRPYARRRCI